MKFGLGTFSCDRHPDDPRSHAALYDEMLDLAQVAEQNAFDSVWVTEHHFTEGGYLPSVTTAMSALAAVTDELRIGSNIALGPLYRQPLRLAEDLAVLDNISDGRITFGVGNGYRPAEFDGFGIPLDQRALRLENLLEILQKAWSGDPVYHEGHSALGDGFEFDGVPVTPTPVQDDGPKVIIGGFAPPAIERAARMADGFTMGSLFGMDNATQSINIYQDAINEVGKDLDDQELVLWNYAFLHDQKDPDDIVSEGWQHTVDQYCDWFETTGGDPEKMRAGLNEATMFYDSPETMIESIEEYQEQFGDDIHFIYQAALPGVAYEDFAYSIELFGREVIPAFS